MADQLYKKAKREKKQKKEGYREIAPYRYLIVCEGEKTEPLYFEGIKQLINNKYGDKIKVKNVKADRFEIDGTGRNTENLVRYTIEKRKNAVIPYGQVWCVFDKDSFTSKHRNAKKLYANYQEMETPANMKPATKVFEIIEELNDYLEGVS